MRGLALPVGPLLELGPGEAGQRRRHGHARAPHLLVQGVGERAHEGLGGPVGGAAGHGVEPSDGGDVEHGAAPPLHHGTEGGGTEAEHGEGVDLHLLLLPVHRQLVERTVGAEAGVVDQQVHRTGPVRQSSLHRVAGHRGGQVCRQHLHRHAVGGGQFPGQRLQPVLVTGHHHQVRPLRGQAAGDGIADAAGRAGDQGRGPSWGWHGRNLPRWVQRVRTARPPMTTNPWRVRNPVPASSSSRATTIVAPRSAAAEHHAASRCAPAPRPRSTGRHHDGVQLGDRSVQVAHGRADRCTGGGDLLRLHHQRQGTALADRRRLRVHPAQRGHLVADHGHGPQGQLQPAAADHRRVRPGAPRRPGPSAPSRRRVGAAPSGAPPSPSTGPAPRPARPPRRGCGRAGTPRPG